MNREKGSTLHHTHVFSYIDIFTYITRIILSFTVDTFFDFVKQNIHTHTKTKCFFSIILRIILKCILSLRLD